MCCVCFLGVCIHCIIYIYIYIYIYCVVVCVGVVCCYCFSFVSVCSLCLRIGVLCFVLVVGNAVVYVCV